MKNKIIVLILFVVLIIVTGCKEKSTVFESDKYKKKEENIGTVLTENGYAFSYATTDDLKEINDEFLFYELDVVIDQLIYANNNESINLEFGWIYKCSTKSGAELLYNNYNKADSEFRDALKYYDDCYVVITNVDNFINIIQ